MFTVESSYCFLVWILTGLWEPLASISWVTEEWTCHCGQWLESSVIISFWPMKKVPHDISVFAHSSKPIHRSLIFTQGLKTDKLVYHLKWSWHHNYRPIPSQEVDYKISVAACWETPLWENTLLSDLLFMPAPQRNICTSDSDFWSLVSLLIGYKLKNFKANMPTLLYYFTILMFQFI